ncbi:L-fucose isomerase [Echinicola vietnamensis]|uniref:L-fucose isomerase family protein n=1 Tax=Echinicola vietnamensis (strain DSM 17526 / LMG 23754 / KMM 6221) TaxID=926556 RepID=L0G577_ECHVK|nr:L-fucose isomerase [Echinicola vietnamensis]AGA80697.1 L-fucose isomerase family protein [Echinicola vietnamensis DSM 17526]
MKSANRVYVVASGDLRLSANQVGWAFQDKMEELLSGVLKELGWEVERGHAYNQEKQHGFIDSQRMGIEVFKPLDPTTPIIVAESVWQYTHHVLPGLYSHNAPILVLANWDGKSSGLVGALNLKGSLTKAGIAHSCLWSTDFTDSFFIEKLKEWLETGKISHDLSHVKELAEVQIPTELADKGRSFAHDFKQGKAIMGVFDEGCMGMYNAIIPDTYLHQLGVFKERLSQSALYAEMSRVGDDDAYRILTWLEDEGMHFEWGKNPQTELTREQTLEQCKMYIAAVRIADEFGCDTIGIQYQQGLKDLVAASDLAEGLLNNVVRPPVYGKNGEELYKGKSIPHFNEVDECAGLDGLITTRLWEILGLPPENTLHDIRWGEDVEFGGRSEFVWVFLISGAVPPAHFIDGFKGASSERQPPMYFQKGGGSLKGISKPGYIVWSRIYMEDESLFCDIGIGEVVELPLGETQRRWHNTTPQWPIMNVVLPGVSRDQMMAKHQANHIQVAYGESYESTVEAAYLKASALDALGIKVRFCGEI